MKLKPIRFGDLPVGAKFHTGKRPQKSPAVKTAHQTSWEDGETLYNYFRPKLNRPDNMGWGMIGTFGAILDGSTVYIEVPNG